jgi:RHS repeat-associated protein
MYDGQRNVTKLVSGGGLVLASYYYDSFGNIVDETGDAENSITFAGSVFDKEVNLYYMNSRYYDARIARFMTEDTFRGDPGDALSLNLYTYCSNNPLIYYDPTGHFKVSKEGNTPLYGVYGEKRPGSSSNGITVGSSGKSNILISLADTKSPWSSSTKNRVVNVSLPNGTMQLGIMDDKGTARLANKYGEFVVSAPKDSIIIITKDSNDIRNERASGGYILQVAGESGYFGEMDRMYSPEVLEAMDEYRAAHEVEKDSSENDGSYEVEKAGADVLSGALGLGSLLEGMLSSGSAVSGFGVIYIPIPDKVRVEPNSSNSSDSTSAEDTAGNDSQTSDKDSRLKGNPGDINTQGTSETEIGPDGRAIRERHNTDHGNPKIHSNPHDHNIDWTPEGKPIFGRPINYPNGAPPLK